MPIFCDAISISTDLLQSMTYSILRVHYTSSRSLYIKQHNYTDMSTGSRRTLFLVTPLIMFLGHTYQSNVLVPKM